MSSKQMFLAAAIASCTLSAPAQSPLDDLLSPARLPYLKNSSLHQISSNDTSGGNNDFVAIPAGAVCRLAEIRGPGLITNLWVTISSPDRYMLRRILLRMYWDGEGNPSVEVPIGDFFGTGFEYRQYITPFVGMSSGGYYSYFPMPFNSSARIEVVNETGAEIPSFYYHIDYHALASPLEPAVAYFHATWHREIRTDRKECFTLLEAEGEGHLVGVNMSMQSYDGGLGFLEGDEMFYVDGQSQASVKGTGTEDYFNSGWYFNRGEFSAPYHGLILKDDTLGRIAAYRFHILDAVPFRKSIRALIEHGTENREIADYSATAYWYQKEPHRPFAKMLPPGLRIPLRVQVPNGALEAESLTPRETSLPFSVEEMSAWGAEWSDRKQLKVDARKDGDEFSLAIPVPEDRYDVDCYFTKGPSYGDVQVLSGGKLVGVIRGFSRSVLHGGRVALDDFRARNGHIALRFIVVGKDARSGGYAVGLDAFALKPRRTYIPEWNLIGPFPNPRDGMLTRRGLDSAYAPEKELDLSKGYTGVNGQRVFWQRTKTPVSGRVDLSRFDPNELVVVYGLTYIHSSKDQTLPLLLGSDDGVKVILNGKVIHRVLTIRVAEPDQDTVPLQLKRGWNTLLLKIENNLGGYGFYARILDPEECLTFSATGGE